MEVPLFVDEEWWGTIGFDEMVVERTWSPAEVDALRIAAGILSAAIQRQKADSTVQESERIYRQAIVAAGAVPYYRDYVENRYTFMGAEIEKMIGYKPEEVTTALWRSLVLEDIQTIQGAELSLGNVLGYTRRGKFKEWKSDMRMRVKDGAERWLADSAIELIDDANVPYASIGILQDITERKQTEGHLRKREAILAAVTFAAEQFLKSSNWRERIEMVLERLGHEFGASHAYLFEKHIGLNGEVRTSMIYEWTAPDCISDLGNAEFQEMPPQPMGFARMYQTLDRGEPLIASTSFFTEAERTYMQSINIKAMLEMRVVVNGQHWGTIGVDDVLNEREWTAMEVDAIKVAANVLGAAIKRQMDEDSLQKELDERQKLIGELENKNSELERFTYTVSHDLKSPLVTINGFLGYLEQDAASGNLVRMKRDLQRIHEAVKKMQNLLNELLELSRIGRVVNAPESVRFNDLVREALYIVNGRLEANQVTVFVEPDMPVVNVDKPRVIEVLQNLLDNAAKYMGGQDRPHIEVGLNGEDVERGMPVFYVKDNGIGISSQFHQRVFGLFDKLDPKSEGTGVGLALVKRIIEVHGGQIWVESELGQGSTFYFTLPGEGIPK
jgi:PAS domain S-box-containing protein